MHSCFSCCYFVPYQESMITVRQNVSECFDSFEAYCPLSYGALHIKVMFADESKSLALR